MKYMKNRKEREENKYRAKSDTPNAKFANNSSKKYPFIK